MTPEADRFLQTAQKHLERARIMLSVGLNEDTGRAAYLAGFHAAQAFIFEKIGKVQVPKLFMHGTADNVIPHTMSDDLYKLASEPKRLVKFEGASHSGIAWAAPQDYVAQVRQFVAATMRRSHAQASASSATTSDQPRPH